MRDEDLWLDGGKNDLASVQLPNRRSSNAGTSRHIGCPLAWFKRVLSVVHGRNELAIALYVYRLRAVQRRRTVVVSNAPLLADLGLDRYAKYRALRRLAEAGIVTVKRNNKRATVIVFHDQKSRRSRKGG
jgi:hypothetical protein